MNSHNMALYNVFDRNQLFYIISESEQMPSLESILNQLTKNTAANPMKSETDDQAANLKVQACCQLVDAAIQRDQVTRLYDGTFDALVINAANLYSSKDAKNESYIIEGDFSNLYNCNKAIGKARTNEIMAIIINMYKEAFNDILPAPSLIYGSRSGGDEFRFVVAGVSEEQLNKGITAARTKIEEFMTKTGLDQLEHSKHPGNPVRSGVGAEVAYKKLPVEFPSYDLESELDEVINKNKRDAGMRKAARGRVLVEQPANISESPERLNQVDLMINTHKIQQQAQKKDFPFYDEVLEHQPGSIFKKHKDEIEKKAAELGMNEQQTSLFISLLDNIYDIRDEKTGMMRNRDFIDSINDFMLQAKESGQPCYILKMEAYNFSSLNEIFSHFGNDTIFRQMAEITSRHLENLGAVCFSRGGGIISPVLPGKQQAEINQAMQNIIDDFHRLIGNKSIKEYCEENNIKFSPEALKKLNIDENNKINDIPSIRGFIRGSGFVISEIDLRHSADFVQVLSHLDQLNEQNKKTGVAFTTTDNVTYLNGKKTEQAPVAQHTDEIDARKSKLFSGLEKIKTQINDDITQLKRTHPGHASIGKLEELYNKFNEFIENSMKSSLTSHSDREQFRGTAQQLTDSFKNYHQELNKELNTDTQAPNKH